jgi:hypothetical protein
MYSGARWIKAAFGVDMSPLGIKVANILGRIFFGIYHLDSNALKRVDWANNNWIEFVYRGDLATIDFDNLTALVVYSHDEMIRVCIDGQKKGYLKLQFHQRSKRSGSILERLPEIEDHIKILRSYDKAE